MSTLDKAIAVLEETAVKVAAKEIMAHLVVHVWAGFAWPVIGPIVSYLVSYVAAILMVRLDWLAFMLVKNWQVTKEGQDFIKGALELEKAQQSGDQAVIEQAQKEKEDAFRKLIGLGSPA